MGITENDPQRLFVKDERFVGEGVINVFAGLFSSVFAVEREETEVKFVDEEKITLKEQEKKNMKIQEEENVIEKDRKEEE